MLLRSPLVLAALLCGALPCLAAHPAHAREPRRFFLSGDGTLSIRSTKNRFRFNGRFRTRDGRYLPAALRRINRVIGTRYSDRAARVSLRFIEVLSFLRATLHGGVITVSSGYRSPRYNRSLRAKGRTVAKASLHQYGMAADLHIARVAPKLLWQTAKKHRVGGAGYYKSRWVHIDVGPPRSWTQGTANVRKGVSDDNKRLIVVPELDRYRSGETMSLRLARMTAYPLGVRQRWILEKIEGADAAVKVLASRAVTPRRPRGAPRSRGGCTRYRSIAALSGFSLRLSGLAPGRYRVRVGFCAIKWPAMPKEIVSRPFEVLAPPKR
ncbi:MAG: YcbK family protein [Myxococcales bacterium]|nr:YcbK family protein [Myxococcales bacterium]